jgi:uncharacterized protein (DUF736 family)
MRGYLYPNNKGDNPARPDFRGKLTDGQVLAAWYRFDKDGKQYIALSIDPPRTGDVVDDATTTDPVAA